MKRVRPENMRHRQHGLSYSSMIVVKLFDLVLYTVFPLSTTGQEAKNKMYGYCMHGYYLCLD